MLDKNKLFIFVFALLLIFSLYVRFSQLGYSTFYGDETKTLYFDKTVPALTFLFDQRKGPVQFLASWIMEKISGGFDEFWIRLPFATAGLLSVLVFYILARKFMNQWAALASSFLYSFSGFSVAFSRTAQYQQFLLLFGLLGILLMFLSLEKNNRFLLIISALAFSISLLSHYDGIFYLLIGALLFFNHSNVNVTTIRKFVLFFIFPALILSGLFYIPYLLNGYFESNSLSYLLRRVFGGAESGIANSFYTVRIYNPLVLPFIVLMLSVFGLNNEKLPYRKIFFVWFIVPFILFEFLTLNPGTHIFHYLVPLILIFGCYGQLILTSGSAAFKIIGKLLIIFIIIAQVSVSIWMFVPHFKSNYPWRESRFMNLRFPKLDKKFQVFTYGFPYDRGFREIRDHLDSVEGIRGIYTNDNDVVAKYYFMKYDYTPPGPNFLPPYYVNVYNNHEQKDTPPDFLASYTLVKEFYVEGELVSELYKLNAPED